MSGIYVFQEINVPLYLRIKNHEGFMYLLNISETGIVGEAYLKTAFERYVFAKIKEIAEREKLVAVHLQLDGSLYGLVEFLKSHGFYLNDDMLSMVYSFFSRDFNEIKTHVKLPRNITVSTFDDCYLDEWIECIKNSFNHKERFELIRRNFNIYWKDDTSFDKNLHLQAIDEKTNKVVGILSCFYYPDKKAAHIKLVAVRRRYQNKGIGKYLIQEILKKLNKMSCNYVSLDVNALNAKAIHVYKKMGFEIKNNLSLTKIYYNRNSIKKSW